MTHARAKIWARLIRKGQLALKDVQRKDRAAVRAAFFELFGENL